MMRKSNGVRCGDRAAFVCFEHGRLERRNGALVFGNSEGEVELPPQRVAVAMLGPGVSATSAAVGLLAGHGCAVCWTGEGGTRLLASAPACGDGARLERQARAWASPAERSRVARRMMEKRFGRPVPRSASVAALRGMEGVWMQEAYAALAARFNVPWQGRQRGDWAAADPANRAVSAANAALYALVHAALLAGGWSPGLGFLHSGNARAFVFDVADLYKADTSLPVAFAAAAESADGVEKRVRAACVGRFWAAGLPGRVFDDVKEILDDPAPPAQSTCKDPRHVEQLDA